MALCILLTCLYQCKGFSIDNFVKTAMMIRLIRSACQLPRGIPVVISVWIASFSQYSLKSFDVNAIPLSVIILLGFPNVCCKICNLFNTSLVPMDFVGKIHVNFVNASIATSK